MTKPRKPKSSPRKLGRKAKKQQSVEYLLEVGTLDSMRAAKQRTQDFLDFQWLQYSELAYQRNQNLEAIKKALISSSISDFKFEGWQRAALQETLGQESDPTGQLTPQEVALTNPQSETIVAVSGYLEKVFDLRTHNSLNAMVSIIKHFEFSDAILARAKRLKIDTPNVIQTSKELLGTLLAKNWRDWPENLDVPANSQVFGNLLYIAGLEGVVYPSKLTGKDCLAIFTHNFDKGSSFIQIDGETPNPKVPKRIDAKTWPICDFNFDDLHDADAILQ